MKNYDKVLISFDGWLRGKQYYKALSALNLAKEVHVGTRQDGSPELSHPLAVALFIRTLATSLLLPEETIASGFLHDSVEDHRLSLDNIRNCCGDQVAEAVMLLSKINMHGVKRSHEDYFSALALNPIASIVKGADRIHNIQTMIGPFSLERQERYLVETHESILPMLKRARKLFPQQELAYFNLKFMIDSQVELIKAIHSAV